MKHRVGHQTDTCTKVTSGSFNFHFSHDTGIEKPPGSESIDGKTVGICKLSFYMEVMGLLPSFLSLLSTMIISLPSSSGMSSGSSGSSTPSFKVTQLQCSRRLDSGLLGSIPGGVAKELAY